MGEQLPESNSFMQQLILELWRAGTKRYVMEVIRANVTLSTAHQVVPEHSQYQWYYQDGHCWLSEWNKQCGMDLDSRGNRQ
jgi:hypothetical protein